MTLTPRSISVFFPAYNEEANIARSVAQAQEVLTSLGVADYEIAIVNDGSRDRTRKIVEELCHCNARVRLVNHEVNQGYGASVWSGIMASSKDYIFFTDADLQFDLTEISRLLAYVPEFDVVVGFRIKRQDNLIRVFNAWAWNVLNRVLFGLQVKDIDCAFKLFKREVFSGLQVTSRGAMFSAELLVRVVRLGFKVAEVGVTHYPRRAGSATGGKLSVILRAFRELFQTYASDLGSKTVKQLIKFGCVGVLNTLVDWVAYLLLGLLVMPSYPVTAKVISYSVGILNSYCLNKYWTFASRGRVESEFPKFVLANAMSLVLNAVVMYSSLQYLHTPRLGGLVLATLGSFALNFSTCRLVVFSRASESKGVLLGLQRRTGTVRLRDV